MMLDLQKRIYRKKHGIMKLLCQIRSQARILQKQLYNLSTLHLVILKSRGGGTPETRIFGPKVPDTQQEEVPGLSTTADENMGNPSENKHNLRPNPNPNYSDSQRYENSIKKGSIFRIFYRSDFPFNIAGETIKNAKPSKP